MIHGNKHYGRTDSRLEVLNQREMVNKGENVGQGTEIRERTANEVNGVLGQILHL